MLLAIDTSAGTSVAIVDRDAGVLAERSSADTRLHAEVIGTLIASCLSDAGYPTEALSAVAAGMGPGPFTGLRVGIAAAQSFALGIGRPVVRVISHDAVAFDHYARGGTGPVLVVTDARRREVYWSRYDRADEYGIPIRVDGPGLSAPDAVTTADREARIDAYEVSAAALGMLAERMHQHARQFAGETPVYLRSPDVTVSAGPKRVSA